VTKISHVYLYKTVPRILFIAFASDDYSRSSSRWSYIAFPVHFLNSVGLLEPNRRRSRIRWSSLWHGDSGRMRYGLYQQRHLRCHRLGTKQRRENLLDSSVNRSQKHHRHRSH